MTIVVHRRIISSALAIGLITVGFVALIPRGVATQSGADRTKALLDQLRSARIIELNFVWDAQSPVLAFNPPFAMALAASHKSTTGMIPGGIAFAGDMMYFSGQHGAPTIDAIGHISSNGKLYGGLDAFANEGPQGLMKLGIETYPRERLINRGVLLDIARFKSTDVLAAGQEITPDDLEGAAKAQGIEIRAGDSLLIRTGYGKFFTADKPKYLGPRPGIGETGARWLAGKQVFLTGMDTMTFDVVTDEGSIFPAHRILIAESGIHIIENMNLEDLGQALATSKVYEFPVVINPLRIRGATASPLNAFAILPQ